MAKKITSFSLDETTLILLKLIAEREDRSQAKTLEHLIKERAEKLKIKLQ